MRDVFASSRCIGRFHCFGSHLTDSTGIEFASRCLCDGFCVDECVFVRPDSFYGGQCLIAWSRGSQVVRCVRTACKPISAFFCTFSNAHKCFASAGDVVSQSSFSQFRSSHGGVFSRCDSMLCIVTSVSIMYLSESGIDHFVPLDVVALSSWPIHNGILLSVSASTLCERHGHASCSDLVDAVWTASICGHPLNPLCKCSVVGHLSSGMSCVASSFVMIKAFEHQGFVFMYCVTRRVHCLCIVCEEPVDCHRASSKQVGVHLDIVWEDTRVADMCDSESSHLVTSAPFCGPPADNVFFVFFVKEANEMRVVNIAERCEVVVISNVLSIAVLLQCVHYQSATPGHFFASRVSSNEIDAGAHRRLAPVPVHLVAQRTSGDLWLYDGCDVVCVLAPSVHFCGRGFVLHTQQFDILKSSRRGILLRRFVGSGFCLGHPSASQDFQFVFPTTVRSEVLQCVKQIIYSLEIGASLRSRLLMDINLLCFHRPFQDTCSYLQNIHCEWV